MIRWALIPNPIATDSNVKIVFLKNYRVQRMPCLFCGFYNETVTVWLLKPVHLKEDCPITTISENKGFSSYFANRPIKVKIQLCNLWKLDSVTTGTGALGRRLSHHIVFCKQKILKLFYKRTIKFKVQLCNRWQL